jgi:hypothetical protein
VHMPIAVAFTTLRPHPMDTANPSSYLVFGGVIAFTILVAYVFGRVFERQYSGIRYWLLSKFDSEPVKNG